MIVCTPVHICIHFTNTHSHSYTLCCSVINPYVKCIIISSIRIAQSSNHSRCFSDICCVSLSCIRVVCLLSVLARPKFTVVSCVCCCAEEGKTMCTFIHESGREDVDTPITDAVPRVGSLAAFSERSLRLFADPLCHLRINANTTHEKTRAVCAERQHTSSRVYIRIHWRRHVQQRACRNKAPQ